MSTPDMAADSDPNNSQEDMTPGCVPEDSKTFCVRNDADCGEFSGVDNCGEIRTSTCGTCEVGECGQENKCEAVRAICEMRGAECGTIVLDTGGEGNCGTCDAPESCGGAGRDNKCGCTDAENACEARMVECGGIEVLKCDGSTELVLCGECMLDAPTCVEGTCRCIPQAKESFCEKFGKCGPAVTGEDNCGVERTEACGCETGEQCYEEMCCQPETDGELCQMLNPPEQAPGDCSTGGSVTDRCGQSRQIACNCLCSAVSMTEECEGRCGDFIDNQGCNKTCAPDCEGGLVCDPGNECCEPVAIPNFCAGRCDDVSKTDNCGVIETRNCGGCAGLFRFCDDTYCVGLF